MSHHKIFKESSFIVTGLVGGLPNRPCCPAITLKTLFFITHLIFLYCMPVFLYTLIIKWERVSHQFLKLGCLLSNNNNNTGEIISEIYMKVNSTNYGK